jgi:hypothetical protein
VFPIGRLRAALFLRTKSSEIANLIWHLFEVQSLQTICPEVSTPFRPPATFCQSFGLGTGSNNEALSELESSRAQPLDV